MQFTNILTRLIIKGASAMTEFPKHPITSFSRIKISLSTRTCDTVSASNQFVSTAKHASHPSEKHQYGAPFVKILYLTDLAQKLLSLLRDN